MKNKKKDLERKLKLLKMKLFWKQLRKTMKFLQRLSKY